MKLPGTAYQGSTWLPHKEGLQLEQTQEDDRMGTIAEELKP